MPYRGICCCSKDYTLPKAIDSPQSGHLSARAKSDIAWDAPRERAVVASSVLPVEDKALCKQTRLHGDTIDDSEIQHSDIDCADRVEQTCCRAPACQQNLCQGSCKVKVRADGSRRRQSNA